MSVKTKIGNTFYIFIDRRISGENSTANVYFLNKVDEYDLLSLVYQPTQSETDPNKPVHPYENGEITQADNGETVTVEDNENSENTPEKGGFKLSLLQIIILAVVIIGVILAFIFANKSNKKQQKKSNYDDDEDDYEDVYEDEDEDEKKNE